MTDDLREMIADFGKSGTIPRRNMNEATENQVELPQPPPSNLLAESDHYLSKLESEAPCSEQDINGVVDFLKQMETTTAGFIQSSGEVDYRQGQILNALKKHLQLKSGKKRFGWRRWAESNIKFIAKRKMQNLMQVAEKSYLRPYAVLGMERQLKLLRVTKNRNESNPVGSFLQEHGITLPEDGNPISGEFKSKVDRAIASAKTRRSRQNPSLSITEKFNRDATKIETKISSILESQDLVRLVDRDKVASLKNKLAELESFITN